MLFRTHMLVGICGLFILASLLNFDISMTIICLVVFGSILPDLDSPGSYVNKRYLLGFGKGLSKFSKHRGFYHSVFGLLFVDFIFFTVLMTLSFLNFINLGFFLILSYVTYLGLGYFLHLFADTFTSQGIIWFWKYSEFQPKGPIKTGSTFENVVFLILFCIAVYFLAGQENLDHFFNQDLSDLIQSMS